MEPRRIIVRILASSLFAFTILLGPAGCSIFGQKTGNGNKVGGAGNSGETSKIPDPFPVDDPLGAPAAHSAAVDGIIAGRVIDQYNRELTETYVRWTPLNDKEASQAPIDVAVSREGYFTIQGLQRGQQYKLQARSKRGDKTLAGVAYITAPNPRVVITLKEELVTPETPPFPQPPTFPGDSKAGDAHTPDANDSKHRPAPPVENQARQQTTEFTPGTISIPQPGHPELQRPGTAQITPTPKEVPGAANIVQPDWSGQDPPREYPKSYPQGIVGVEQPNKDPLVRINPPTPGVPQFPQDTPKNGFGTPAPNEGNRATNPPAETRVPSCVLMGKTLVNMALLDVYDQPWEWKKNRLGKLVLLDFWKTSCLPCLDAITNLRILQERYGYAGLEVIGIAAEYGGTLSEQKYRIARVAQRKQTNYRLLMASEPRNPVLESFQVRVLPTMVLIDGATGEIVWRHEGSLSRPDVDALESYIRMRLGVR